jgi:phosphate transport system substrate-binding protein
MTNLKLKAIAATALLGGMLAASHSVLAATPTVTVDGSSTVYPITEAVAEDFQKSKKNKVQVTVGISGTGGGFKKFCRGETDISDASRPILEKEMKLCAENGIKYIELPVAFDALTVVIHPKNIWAEKMTVAELKMMWEPAAQGKIMRWNQVNPAWPDAPLKLFGAGADSGTFDYFTEAIVGKSKSSRGDFTASEDDNVLVQGVSRDENALGFFGLAYYHENQNKLKAAAIIEKAGKPAVLPSVETVMKGTYQPLARPIFIYVSSKAVEKAEVREFIEFYIKNAPALVKEVGYVPLGDADYSLALKNFNNRKLGTGFGGGAEVGIEMKDLLTREGKH